MQRSLCPVAQVAKTRVNSNCRAVRQAAKLVFGRRPTAISHSRIEEVHGASAEDRPGQKSLCGTHDCLLENSIVSQRLNRRLTRLSRNPRTQIGHQFANLPQPSQFHVEQGHRICPRVKLGVSRETGELRSLVRST
jgi:hypothetical protein